MGDETHPFTISLCNTFMADIYDDCLKSIERNDPSTEPCEGQLDWCLSFTALSHPHPYCSLILDREKLVLKLTTTAV